MMPFKDKPVWRYDSLLMLYRCHAPVRIVLLVDVHISTITGNVILILRGHAVALRDGGTAHRHR